MLAGAAALTTLTLAPGVVLMAPAKSSARAAGEAASSKVRWGLLIDVRNCPDGCNACVTGCQDEHGWAAEDGSVTDVQWIRNVTVKDRNSGASKSVPVMCQHCANPPCVDVCPTGASFKRADGIVLVDKHRCIGCRYCMVACPYDARSFVHEAVSGQKPYTPRGKGTVESCTMCVHRVDAGGIPACVEACNKTDSKAMLFGDLNDPESEISIAVARLSTTRIRDDLGTDTGVHYTGL
jgi:molybdopterin-containing oxidoreductase family iron-sulfur binding subunit